jgi:hypothetical protein
VTVTARHRTNMEILQSCGLLSIEKTKLKRKGKEEKFAVTSEAIKIVKRDCVPHSVTRQGCSADPLARASAKNPAPRSYETHVRHSDLFLMPPAETWLAWRQRWGVLAAEKRTVFASALPA